MDVSKSQAAFLYTAGLVFSIVGLINNVWWEWCAGAIMLAVAISEGIDD